jgi:prepilin-type N-terminal cleavage/methylation domain-containing protein
MNGDPRQVTSDRTPPAGDPRSAAGALKHPAHAFTILELLVVISIMGIIAALTVPALKNLGKSNLQTSATRQLLDGIGRARQLAMSQHTTVYMVFVPTNFFNLVDNYNNVLLNDINSTRIPAAGDLATALTTMSNLVAMQLSGYNFVSYGQVGDQPGQHAWHYLSTWQSLPEGTYIAAEKFSWLANSPLFVPWQSDYAGKIDTWRWSGGGYMPQIYSFTNAGLYIPFPTEKSPSVYLPLLAFDYTGKLISETAGNAIYHHAYIPLAQGSVGYARDLNKNPLFTTLQPPALDETPPGNETNISYNIIDVDPLSGRATLMTHQVQ